MADIKNLANANKDDPKTLILKTFKNAEAEIPSYEFPELDDSLVSINFRNSAPSTSKAEPAPRWHNDIDEIKEDLDQDAFRSEKNKEWTALSSPLRIPSTRHGVKPQSPFPASLYSHGVLNDQSDPKKQEDDGFQLSSSEWETLYQLCSFFDEQLSDPIDEHTTYNTNDAKLASSLLGFPEPEGELLLVMLEVGLRVNLFAKEKGPWTAALLDVQQRAQAHLEQQILQKLRINQESQASDVESYLTRRKFFAMYREALMTDIYMPKQILRTYELRKLLPLYFASWRKVYRDVNNAETAATQYRNNTVLRNATKQIRDYKHECECLELQAVTMYELSAKSGVMRLWVHSSKETSSRLQAAARYRQRRVCGSYLRFWQLCSEETIAAQIMRAARSKQVLRSMAISLKQHEDLATAATHHFAKHFVLAWRKKIWDLQRLSALTQETTINLKRVKMLRNLQNWQLEAQLAKWKSRNEVTQRHHYFALLRRSYLASMMLNTRDRGIMTSVFAKWHQSAIRAVLLNDYAEEVCIFEERGIKTTVLSMMSDALKDRLQQVEIQNRSYSTSLKKKYLRFLRHREDAIQSLDQRGSRYRNILLVRRTLAKLTHVSAKHRDQRLEGLLETATEQQRQVAVRTIIRTWKRSALTKGSDYLDICALQEQAELRAAFALWRSLAQKVTILHIQSKEERDYNLAKISFKRWNMLSAETREHLENARSIDIVKLASLFKTELRWWQQVLSSSKAQTAQADRYFQRDARGAALEYLQKWMQLVESQGLSGSKEPSSSLLVAPDRSESPLYPAILSPRRKVPMTPQTLQRLKAKSTGRTRLVTSQLSRAPDESPPFGRDYSIGTGQRTSRNDTRIRDGSYLATPTRPSLRKINDSDL